MAATDARPAPGTTPPAVESHHQQRWQRARAVPARGRPRAVEEQFASRLRRGDRFQFGRAACWSWCSWRDMTAFVRLARGRVKVSCPAGREASCRCRGTRRRTGVGAVRRRRQCGSALAGTAAGTSAAGVGASRPGPRAAGGRTPPRRPVPLVYPFAGRHVHEALAALLALRCTRQQRNSIGYAVMITAWCWHRRRRSTWTRRNGMRCSPPINCWTICVRR